MAAILSLSGASGLHCFFSCTHALAAAGDCYVGAPPRPGCARYDRVLCKLSLPYAGYDRCGMHESFPLLISRARKRPIASTGRQGNCHSACRASMECEAAQLRNAVCQTDTHSEAAGASRASIQAEVCGPVCLAVPRQQQHSEAAGASNASDQAELCGPAYLALPGQKRSPHFLCGVLSILLAFAGSYYELKPARGEPS